MVVPGSEVLHPHCANSYGCQFHCGYSLQALSPCCCIQGCQEEWDHFPGQKEHEKELGHLENRIKYNGQRNILCYATAQYAM